MSEWRIEELTARQVRGLAECHIACWREAYRGIVPDHVLDAFEVERRAEQLERFRVAHPHDTVVALHGDEVIGFARAAAEDDAAAERILYALYVRAAWYGKGVAHDLMRAVLVPEKSHYLWVFEANPRAQRFYRKYGFELDGGRQTEAFTVAQQLRMVRPPGPLEGRPSKR